MSPTQQQQAPVDYFSTNNSVVIEACAGAGKTFTCSAMANSSTKRGLYVTFDKENVKRARERFPSYVQCNTGHSLAYAAGGHLFRERLNGGRIPTSEVARILGIGDSLDLGEGILPLQPSAQGRFVMGMVEAFCHSSDDSIQVKHMPDIVGMPQAIKEHVAHTLLDRARWAWSELQHSKGQLRFSHDFYKKMWALTQPVLDFDYVMVDEYQDTNPLFEKIINDQKCQVVVVGDSNQVLYAWRGCVDALERSNGQRFQLQESFRFGQGIADEANKWLEALGSGIRIQGKGQPSSVEVVKKPTAILCRTNAKCISEAAKQLREGHSVAIMKGTEDIKRMAEAASTLKQGLGTFHPQLFMFKTWKQVEEYVEEGEGSDLKTFVQLINDYGTQGVLHLLNKFVKPEEAEVVVSTVHGFKGLESDHVRLANDFKEQKIGQELDRSELMLIYVAVTRAKLSLNCSSVAWINNLI